MKAVLEPKVSKQEYEDAVDVLAEQAFDDQCTGTNPRAPLIKDLRQLMLDAWEPLKEQDIKTWVAKGS